MLKNKYIDTIAIIGMILAIIITIIFMNGKSLGLKRASSQPIYMDKLFDTSRVHEIDIIVPDSLWQSMLDNAVEEEYINCDLRIDGELFKNMAIRVKGNNSKNLTAKYGWDRFSLKIEFDHYSDGRTYYGLDKVSLNSSFQDNSFLKDYMTYHMMDFMDVPSPLCSYSYITVNGDDWGLFVTIEEIEDAFARRNFGMSHGHLYKPDYYSLEDDNYDVALIYTDDEFSSYENIFKNSKFDITPKDKRRLISSLKQLSTGEDLERVVDIDSVVNYFVVQSFVVNLDSYLGYTGHNYYLYEDDGVLSMLPWDYNLAYATYPLGMPNPINDSNAFVNYPIDTPAPGHIMLNRPLFHKLMLNEEIFKLYHDRYNYFIENYFDSGVFESEFNETVKLISPYVKRDPNKFVSYDDYLLAVDTFKNFNLLRAESVSGQLDGSIPSTIKAQSENRDSFIDASSIWIPDLGEIQDLKQKNN